MSEENVNLVLAEAKKKMDKIVTKWFENDPVLLGSWCLIDKIPDPRQKTMGIDSRSYPVCIRFNPYFVNALTLEYLEAVMVSEGFKILLKHPTTRLQKPKAISNMASQITINSSIMGISLEEKLFNDAVSAKKMNLEEGQWFEYYFRQLLDNLPKTLNKVSVLFNKKINEASGESSGNEGQPQQNDGKPEYQKFDKPSNAMKEYFDPSSTSNQDWEINDLLDADVQNMVNEKKGSSKQWGKFTGDAMGAIVAANTPKISYKDILRRFHNSVVSTKQMASRMKVNRRYDLAQPGHKRVPVKITLFNITPYKFTFCKIAFVKSTFVMSL